MSMKKEFANLKAGNPRPGIVFSLGFDYKWKIGGYDYLEYMDRPEAFNPKYHQFDEYNPRFGRSGDFLTYMSNEEKSDGLFNNEKDHLDNLDKEQYRRYENTSRSEGCPKYFGVISFDNEWLEQHGLLVDCGDHYQLNKRKLKEIARVGINKMIESNYKFEPSNVYWNAAIHTNTDNIHIHYSICEYHRLEDRTVTYKGDKQDCIPVKSFDVIKRTMANKIIGNQHVKEITKLRDEIRHGISEAGAKEQLMKLTDLIPERILKNNSTTCGYASKWLKPYRAEIDKTADAIIRSSAELTALREQFDKRCAESQEIYKRAYGVGERHLYENFSVNQREELYNRCGNEILNAVRALYKMRSAHPSDEGATDAPTSFTYAEQISPALPNIPPVIPPPINIAEQYDDLPDVHPSDEYCEPSEADIEEYMQMKYQDAAENSEQFYDDPPADFPENSFEPPAELEEFLRTENSEDAHPSDKGGDDLPETDFQEQKKANAHPSEEKADSNDLHIAWTANYKKALAYLYGDNSNPENIIKRNPEQALKILLSESMKGNILATHDIGKIYANKILEPNDESKLGDKYYTKALADFQTLLVKNLILKSQYSGKTKAEKKLAWEISYLHYRIGKMYDRGLGTEQDYQTAREHYEHTENNKYAYFSLGNLYKYGHGVNIDYAKAVDYYEKSVRTKGGMPFASYALGYAYENGQGVEQNNVEAHRNYAAALQGFEKLYEKNKDDSLCYKIGFMYLKGKGTDIDLDKAEKYLLKAAEHDNEYAQYALGKLYLREEHLDLSKAEQYLRLSAEHDNQYAQYALGKLYLREDHLDLSKAEQYLRLSAEHDNQYAQYALGKLYLREDHPDLSKAEQYLRLSAEHDNQYAQYALGKLYLREDHLDLSKAEQYLRLSAEHDNEAAQLALGKLYMKEQLRNCKLAEHYLLKASDKGNTEAQYSLGKLFLIPDNKDWNKAEHYLLSAAEKNHINAQLKLGIEYFKRKNYTDGQKWLKTAAAGGNEFAEQFLREQNNRHLKAERPSFRQKQFINVAVIDPTLNRLVKQMDYHTRRILAEYDYDEQMKQMQSRTY